MFGEDYYIELQRHGITEQDKVNEVLVKVCKKYNVKVIATNDITLCRSKMISMHMIFCFASTPEKNKAHSGIR